MSEHAWCLFLAAMGALSGCGGGTGMGTLDVLASGEEAAIEGYPTSTGIAFVDGWSIDLDRVIVSVDAFTIAHAGAQTPLETDPVLINLHDGEASVWTFPGVPAQRFENVGYRMVPATAAARHIGTIRPEDVTQMSAGGLAILLQGTAHHADHPDVVLDLGVPMEIHTSHCTNAIDMSDGIVVSTSGTRTVEMTFHLDHFFFDSIIASEPDMRFEAYAAAAGADRVVTFDDLASQPLADLHAIDGSPLIDAAGALVFYDPGSTPLVMQNLREFVFHQATTIAHLNGEGHCQYEIVPAAP